MFKGIKVPLNYNKYLTLLLFNVNNSQFQLFESKCLENSAFL